MNPVLKLYNRLSPAPGGRWLFSRLICLKAPYFGSIKPSVTEMRPGCAVVELKQRWRVQNHIGTVHAIAVCNLCEMAMGMAAEATIPSHLRWLPKGIRVEYLKKSSGCLSARCEIAPEDFVVGEVDLPVDVTNAQGELVVRAIIPLHITEKTT